MNIVLACSRFHGPLEKMHANILIRAETFCFSPTLFIAIHVFEFCNGSINLYCMNKCQKSDD